MRIAVTGSTGLIGQALVAALQRDGHTVHRLVRSRGAVGDSDIYWSVADGEIDGERLEGVDGVVHLAGEPIASGRWTDTQKGRIRTSRVAGTELLSSALARLDAKPRVLVSGSAIGVYGNRGDEVLTEASVTGSGFLPEVVVAWEAAADAARAAGIRVAHPRTGIVLDRDDGALAKMLPPFKAGIGGRIGSGRQFMSWISLHDEVRALRFLLDGDLEGPVNVTAPDPATNAEFTVALGEVLRRPTVMPVPGLAIRALYGEMGRELVIDGQRVVPEKLLGAGFTFEHRDLTAALRAVLG